MHVHVCVYKEVDKSIYRQIDVKESIRIWSNIFVQLELLAPTLQRGRIYFFGRGQKLHAPGVTECTTLMRKVFHQKDKRLIFISLRVHLVVIWGGVRVVWLVAFALRVGVF